MKQVNFRGVAAAAALLACAAGAQAQGAVQVFGLVDVSAGRTQEPGAAGAYKIDNGKMTTSHWGLRGAEDLGGGVQGVFSVEGFFRADTGESGRFGGDAMWSRSAYVGLSSPKLGTVRLGRNTTLLFVSTVSFNAFGDSYGFSPTVRHVYTGGTVTGDSGWSDSIAYGSPTLGGVRVNVMAAAGEGNGRGNWSGSAVYNRGAFAATAAIQDVRKGATVDDTRTWQLGAAYDLGAAKVFLQHTNVENRTAAAKPEYRLTDLTAAVPVGAGRVLAGYGLLDRSTGTERTTFSLGYDHLLSKRTDAYLMAMQDKDEAATSRRTAHTWAVGVRHRF